MTTVCRLAALAGLMLALVAGALAQDQDKASVKTAAASTFGSLPGLPSCVTLSVQRGDPTKGAAVILAKMTSGCDIPWYWHSAAEQVMIVSGKARIAMKDATTTAVSAGDYIYLPSKHHYHVTCTAATTFFAVTDGAFDIHYVDKDGKEIPPDQALKPAAKPAAKSGGKK